MKAVSLFDFDSAGESIVSEQAWGNLSIPGEACSVLIGIARERLDSAKFQSPNEVSNNIHRLRELGHVSGLMHIPGIEAIYAGAIQTSQFAGYFLTDGGGRFLDVSVGADAYATLLQSGAAWRAQDESRTTERQARGEDTLAEIVKSSSEST